MMANEGTSEDHSEVGKMSEKLDDLRDEISNVMTDDEVDDALRLIDAVEHEYENRNPTDVPALDRTDVGSSALVEDALMHGNIETVEVANMTEFSDPKTHRVTLDIVVHQDYSAERATNYMHD